MNREDAKSEDDGGVAAMLSRMGQNHGLQNHDSARDDSAQVLSTETGAALEEGRFYETKPNDFLSTTDSPMGCEKVGF